MKNGTLIPAATSLLLLAFAASAQRLARCELEVNLVDTGAEGTNVRSGAGKSFSIVGKLHAMTTDFAHVVASQDSWVKINEAGDEQSESVDKIDGWVFASLFGMSVARNPSDKKGEQPLYAEANRKARQVALLPADVFVTLVGCDGKWARISFQGKTGWLPPQAQCTNTKTTCS